MKEIDLGSALVALVPVPTGPSRNADEVDVLEVTDEKADALRSRAAPKRLPGGLSFRSATVVTGSTEMIVSTYVDPSSGRSITLAQTPTSGLKTPDGAKATLYAVGEDLDEVELAGAKAARVTVSTDPKWRGTRSSLVWIAGESVFQLSGRGTSESELEDIAASV